MMKLSKILFMYCLILGTLISITAYSWLNMWIGLEINLLSIIPLMKSNNNKFPAEATLKYFITQALASTFILFAIMLKLNNFEFVSYNLNSNYDLILNSALLTKMGAAPFHMWFPEVMEGLDWSNSTLLLTWQKLAPMVLVMYNIEMTMFMSLIIIFSSLIGGIMGLNQISLRKILAYSSINHIAWMLASMMNFKMIWFIYFIIYTAITLNLIFMFYLFKVYNLTQLIQNLNNSKTMKILFMMNFLSLGGLPPFIGFLPKWMVINNLVESKFYLLSFILIIFTLITLYFYLRITFSTLTFSSNDMIMVTSKYQNFNLILLNSIVLLSLISCTSIFNML